MTVAIARATSRETGILRRILESAVFHRLIIGLIVVNAITLGLETSDAVMGRAGAALIIADRVIVAVFVLEILAKVAAYRQRFVRDPWNLFDFAVIGLSILPATSAFSVFRAFRVLRVLRLISAVPSMRQVVQGLLNAIPGMATTAGLLLLAFYVFSVIATKLFGDSFLEWFGTLGASMYTLFQIMTLEGWSEGIVRPVMESYPWAWAFFVPFIIVTAFAVLNLFVAIIVNAMSAETVAETTASTHADNERILEEIAALREQIADLSDALRAGPGRGAGRSVSRVASP
jgi:voltage-gated sodium channel